MAEIRRIGATSDILGEGPVWDTREQAFYWVDIRAPAVRRYDWRTARVQSWAMPEMVGSLAVRERGGLLLAMRSSLSFFDPATGKFVQVATPEAGRDNIRFNDGKCDRQGRFWVGTMNDVVREPEGTLYRLDPARGCVAMFSGIRIPNSLACQFGGPNLDVLFVTTAKQKLTPEELARQPLAGALLAIDVGVKGLPEARYAG